MQDLYQLNLYNFNIDVLKNNSAVYLKSLKDYMNLVHSSL